MRQFAGFISVLPMVIAMAAVGFVLQSVILDLFGWTNSFVRYLVGTASIFVGAIPVFWAFKTRSKHSEPEFPPCLETGEYLPSAKTMREPRPKHFQVVDAMTKENAKELITIGQPSSEKW